VSRSTFQRAALELRFVDVRRRLPGGNLNFMS
jgi:hypothetical protein